MIKLSRHEWKDLAKKVAKDWRVLKNIVTNLEEEALNKGVEAGVDATKNAVLRVVHDALSADFGFGPKRLHKFDESFRHHLSLVGTEQETDSENVQQIVLTSPDTDRLKVLIGMSQFLESALSSKSYFTSDIVLKECVNNAYIELNNAISLVKDSISEDDMNNIISDLNDACLYLAPRVIEGEQIEVQ